MPATFEKIASHTLSSPAPNITFSNISQAYTDLQIHLRCKAASANGQHIYVRMGNGSVDTTNIYANQSLFTRGDPAPATSGQWNPSFTSNYLLPYASYMSSDSNKFSAFQFFVFNYSANNTKKAVQSFCNTVTGNSHEYPAVEYSNAMVNTSLAINIIEFRHSNTSINLDTGTSITIYGITKA